MLITGESARMAVTSEERVEDFRVFVAYLVAKRIFDIVVSCLCLLVLWPLLLLIALLIELDSPGPAIFRQERVGERGKGFIMYKFRSMRVDAEKMLDALPQFRNRPEPIFKLKDDQRLTRVGRILRHFSFDELPQLLNVLKGEMSIVGPRPHMPHEVARYQLWQLQRLGIKPGLTCLWQISGRSDLTFADWMRLDLEYIKRRSFWFDLLILLKTIPAMIRGSGAY